MTPMPTITPRTTLVIKPPLLGSRAEPGHFVMKLKPSESGCVETMFELRARAELNVAK